MAVRTQTQTRPAARPQQRQLIIIGVVVALAAVVLVIAVALSGRVNVGNIDYASLPQTRTADGAFVLGNPNAPVTIIEFADFGCPHCQSYHETMQRFLQEYVVTGKAKFEYRTFPTAGGALTQFAGQIMECADQIQPGAYWQLYSYYYELALSARYTDDIGRVGAQRLGIPYSDLLACTSTAQQVSKDVQFGVSNGVSGTPAVMARIGDGPAQWISVNGTTYNRGPVDLNTLGAFVNQFQ